MLSLFQRLQFCPSENVKKFTTKKPAVGPLVAMPGTTRNLQRQQSKVGFSGAQQARGVSDNQLHVNFGAGDEEVTDLVLFKLMFSIFSGTQELFQRARKAACD